MIQPQELRIGNYVEYKGKMLPVLAIDNEAFLSELKYKGLVRLPDKLPNGMVFGSSGIWCAKINPIPITPEILNRLGFALKDSYWTHKDIIFGVVFMGANIEVCFSLHGVITAIPHLPLNELHIFQNIIHSLSGIQLTFKTN
jgi:hypothetical protein